MVKSWKIKLYQLYLVTLKKQLGTDELGTIKLFKRFASSLKGYMQNLSKVTFLLCQDILLFSFLSFSSSAYSRIASFISFTAETSAE